MKLELYAVRVFVRRWDEACTFYRDILGLTERFRNDDIGWAEFDLGGPCIGLERVAPDDEEGGSLVGRLVGVSLRVDNIHAVYDALKAKGVAFEHPPEQQDWGGTLAHLRDPDGNILTLLG